MDVLETPAPGQAAKLLRRSILWLRSQWRLGAFVGSATALVAAAFFLISTEEQEGTDPPQEALVTVRGVMPDGTRYELEAPASVSVNEVQGISAVPVWSDGSHSGEALGVTKFVRATALAPQVRSVQGTAVFGNQLVVRGGAWAMVIELDAYASSRRVDLLQIVGHEEDGLIRVSLPEALRFPEPGELPVDIGVTYRDLAVIRGCSMEAAATCSVDEELTVVPVREDFMARLVRVRAV